MKKSIRNLMIGALMTCGVFAASSSALAASQYVQTDMNFRGGASVTATLIGSVPAGAQVEVLGQAGEWDLVRYNGVTGYIHGGNLGNSYAAPARKSGSTSGTTAGTINPTTTQTGSSTSTYNYFDSSFVDVAKRIAGSGQAKWTVDVNGYLALRSKPVYDAANEIGKLTTGDTVELISSYNTGSYVEVFAPSIGSYGYVNAGYLR